MFTLNVMRTNQRTRQWLFSKKWGTSLLSLAPEANSALLLPARSEAHAACRHIQPGTTISAGLQVHGGQSQELWEEACEPPADGPGGENTLGSRRVLQKILWDLQGIRKCETY